MSCTYYVFYLFINMFCSIPQSQILLVPFSNITPQLDTTFMRFDTSNRSALELTVIGITAAAAAISALRAWGAEFPITECATSHRPPRRRTRGLLSGFLCHWCRGLLCHWCRGLLGCGHLSGQWSGLYRFLHIFIFNKWKSCRDHLSWLARVLPGNGQIVTYTPFLH